MAQGGAQLAGTIKDSSEGVLPGTSVSVVNECTGAMRSTLSNDSGYYVFTGLQPSTYTIKASASGFAVTEWKGFSILTGEAATLNLTLKPAGISESITVVATQEAMADTTLADVGDVSRILFLRAWSNKVVSVATNSGPSSSMPST